SAYGYNTEAYPRTIYWVTALVPWVAWGRVEAPQVLDAIRYPELICDAGRPRIAHPFSKREGTIHFTVAQFAGLPVIAVPVCRDVEMKCWWFGRWTRLLRSARAQL